MKTVFEILVNAVQQKRITEFNLRAVEHDSIELQVRFGRYSTTKICTREMLLYAPENSVDGYVPLVIEDMLNDLQLLKAQSS